MKRIHLFLYICIIFLTFVLRFWQLGNNPPSLDWDEASLAYNSYSLLKTGKDEYGKFLPLSIRSFNDYKPPLYTYLSIIPIAFFGLNEFSTRFISALFGSLTVVIGYFLIRELFPFMRKSFYLLFLFFFAVSPWHIQFSRIAFESNLSIFFFVSGLYFLLKGLYNSKFFFLSMTQFGICLYAYHSPRLIVPFFLVFFTLIKIKDLYKRKLPYFLSLLFFILLIIPIFIQMKNATGARFGSVTVINANEKLGTSIEEGILDGKRSDLFGRLLHNRRIVYAREILAGYLDHFNLAFLFINGDAPGRHHATSMGMLYFWDLPFFAIGVFILLKKKSPMKRIVFLWFLVAPLASSLTSGTPHAVRALLYIPVYQIFIAIGLFFLMQELNKTRKIFLRPLVYFTIFGLFLINFNYYLRMYWIHTPIEEAVSWQWGYKEAVAEIAKRENYVNHIIMTYAYDQPYIYLLFYNRIDPEWYQKQWKEEEIERAKRQFGKYEFRKIEWEKDSKRLNVLLVGTAGEIPDGARGIIKEIHYPDGAVAFRIVQL